jgi:hypothetical protein
MAGGMKKGGVVEEGGVCRREEAGGIRKGGRQRVDGRTRKRETGSRV